MELLRQGQGVLGNAVIDSFGDLSTNAAGDLAILTSLKTANGGVGQAVIRKASTGLSLAVRLGGKLSQNGIDS